MMRIFVYFLPLAILCACAQNPNPAGYPYSVQRKMQATHHWDVLASDVAKSLVPTDAGQAPLVDSASIAPDDNSTFGRTFRTMLATKLTENGIPVVGESAGTAKLDWAVQVVRFDAKRKAPTPPLQFTALSAVGLGIFKLVEQNSELAAVAGGVTLDAMQAAYQGQASGVPHSEVVITVKATRGETSVHRATYLFYVDDEDADQYWNMPESFVKADQPIIKKYGTKGN